MEAQILPPDNPNYVLIFEDEFDSLAMDKTKWWSGYKWNQKGFMKSYCNNYSDTVIRNDSMSYRMRDFENCLLDTSGTGLLKIVSKNENYIGTVWNWFECTHDSCLIWPCDSFLNPPKCMDIDLLNFNYTTNMLRSKSLFKYGYFEMRCKISKPTPPMTNKGIGPNFWLFDGDSVVLHSEIDIFEFDGDTSKFGSAIHYKDITGIITHGINNSPGLINVDFDEFHTFSINWSPEKIDFFLDDSLYVSSFEHSADFIPMPIIIDVNLPLFTRCEFIDTTYTQLPHYYEIDYVRVYQLKSACDSNYLICDYENIDYKHYKNIYVGDVNCALTVPQNKKLYLIYDSRIKLSPNFMLEDGAECYFERIPCFENINIKKPYEIPSLPPPSFYQRQNPIYHVY